MFKVTLIHVCITEKVLTKITNSTVVNVTSLPNVKVTLIYKKEKTLTKIANSNDCYKPYKRLLDIDMYNRKNSDHNSYYRIPNFGE